ncbi:MAG: hypothetical protein N2316_12500 [Spirochaetes bacterium]|nr:hypothetical protein [Spirochaetota bacterium]
MKNFRRGGKTRLFLLFVITRYKNLMSHMNLIASIALIGSVMAVGNFLSMRSEPIFRVVLDPGHGGISLPNIELHGDRFDSISKKYLSPFAEGASHKGLWEHELVYEIAVKTKHLLDCCAPNGDFAKFRQILLRYSNVEPKRIFIESYLSRGPSKNREEILKREDPNAEFRLYDYPNKNGNILPGRISRINSIKPHLVVSLHITKEYSTAYRGLSPVIVAPHSLLDQGLSYLQGKIAHKEFFTLSPYREWFAESAKKPLFHWFLSDVASYFTGYPLTDDGKIDIKSFKGYRYNMVTWAYRDPTGWENLARNHPEDSQYSSSIDRFIPNGKFWEREKSVYEFYRRDNGEEGFGGDNMYASSEIIRFILFSLHLHGQDHPHQKLTKPYISTWSVPLLVNAIAAFVELGSVANARHRYLFIHKQEEIAEGIAVGIYSLLAGIRLNKSSFRYLPKGKRLEFEKYTSPDGSCYFDKAVK